MTGSSEGFSLSCAATFSSSHFSTFSYANSIDESSSSENVGISGIGGVEGVDDATGSSSSSSRGSTVDVVSEAVEAAEAEASAAALDAFSAVSLRVFTNSLVCSMDFLKESICSGLVTASSFRVCIGFTRSSNSLRRFLNSAVLASVPSP